MGWTLQAGPLFPGMPDMPWGAGWGGEEAGPYLGNEGQCSFELLGHDNALNGEHKLGLIGDACWETRHSVGQQGPWGVCPSCLGCWSDRNSGHCCSPAQCPV